MGADHTMARVNKPLKRGILPFSLQEKELLTKLYVNDGLLATEVGEKLKVSARLIYSRLKAHGISKVHPITGVRNKFRAAKYCKSCGQQLPSKSST